MSFSARCDAENVEYNGTDLNALFAQRRNLLRPGFWRMVRDILRFYREAPELLEGDDEGPTLGAYLREGKYSDEFVRWHLIPMGAAVWSTRPEGMLEFPARYLVQFFRNHGFLEVSGRPDWLTIPGGSREYARVMMEPFLDRIRLKTPIARVERDTVGATLVTAAGVRERFDRVILACHSDQALSMLDDPTPLETEVIGAFGYQANDVVLHTDASLMPKRKRAWAAWNYHVDGAESDRANVTYSMNILQGLESQTQFFVTLNHTEAIDPSKILRTFVYHHPVFDHAAVRAQPRHAEVNGTRNTYFAGAYWGYGFHEDGVSSGLAAVEHLKRDQALSPARRAQAVRA